MYLRGSINFNSSMTPKLQDLQFSFGCLLQGDRGRERGTYICIYMYKKGMRKAQGRLKGLHMLRLFLGITYSGLAQNLACKTTQES